MVQTNALPVRIERLSELAHNMWWSWHASSRAVFRSLDYASWSLSDHNPAKMLGEADPVRLQFASRDPAFLEIYDAAIRELDNDILGNQLWYHTSHPEHSGETFAYFSAEFAIHNSLPIYAGGLGILAGDLLKEASDLGLPLIGVGLMYPHGYFRQQIDASGWQLEDYVQLDFRETPISPVRPTADGGCSPLASIPMGDRTVYLGAYLVRVGRVELYLVSTDVERNSPEDRQLTFRLYMSDPAVRLQQEVVLGIGGVRILEALGIRPTVWHGNEGHTAFMMMERVRLGIERGASFEDALKDVRHSTVFTTHTPVPAGHDEFPLPMMDHHMSGYWSQAGANRDAFLGLGKANGDSPGFNMTICGIRTSAQCNGVSKLHGEVTRNMWQPLWPDRAAADVPITHVTNGVHLPTWLSAEIVEMYETHLGTDWMARHDEQELCDIIENIPDEEVWQTRRKMKQRLTTAMTLRAQDCWASGRCNAQQALAMGALFEPEALTIGFVRRFTEYKRPTLLFHDIERLKAIVQDEFRPVQIVFAGKSHPADEASKRLLQQTYQKSLDPDFSGRIAFVEDYDMHMSRLLTRGVDVWLNTPRRPREASGTSGMKASMNGVLHLSVPDGWWPEAYNGSNGWVIGDSSISPSFEEEDVRDSASIYSLLEDEVVRLFYDRDRGGVPHGWLSYVKSAMKSITPQFSARRMVKQYVDDMYVPAIRDSR
ncbi:alpha-glucan family phosphorylase [Chloroflexota bacterium]